MARAPLRRAVPPNPGTAPWWGARQPGHCTMVPGPLIKGDRLFRLSDYEDSAKMAADIYTKGFVDKIKWDSVCVD